MKKALLLLAALLTSYLSYAQTTDRQRQYSEESARLFRTYREQPDNVYNLLLMAHFYRDPQNPMRNFALAYKYVCGA